MPRIRVLLIAESANPEAPSVPLVGWSHSRALAELADVHLVTQLRTRDAIVRAGLVEGRDFTAIDSSRVLEPMFKVGEFFRGGARKKWTVFSAKGWATHTAFSALSYYYFEYLVWARFRVHIQAGEFDLVHRLLPLSPTIPSILATRCHKAGVPFILGPINGGVPWPDGFDEIRKREREWISLLRPLHKLLPGYRATRTHASAIIVGARFTWQQIPELYRHKCVYIPENGIDVGQFKPGSQGPIERPLRVAFVGRLVPLKGVDMLLEAAAPLVKEKKIVVDIIGDGPEMPRLRALVDRAGIDFGVKMEGWLDHDKLHDRLAQSQVFAFPSIRDFGGGVVIEAMALGLVPIVLDYAGPAELVTAKTGFLVKMGNRAEVVTRLRDILEQIVCEPSRILSMQESACRRVRECFAWEAKARQVLQVYEWILGRRADKPDFGMPLSDP
ncbi:MAG: glycosyltransferase [Candidatus Hydrogenedentes bacterium]|nr:glycosyltransferase [Candidatus Hydrogenedentota bacterium]